MTQPRNGLWIAMLAGIISAPVACATSRPKMDENMSAAEHDRAATEDKAEARKHADSYDPKAVRYVDLYPESRAGCDKTLPPDCSPFWSMTKNTTDRELSQAAAHAARARQHRAAARALRETESRACAGVALADQDMSPFLRERDIDAVEELGQSGGRAPQGSPAGAAIAFKPVVGLTVQTLQRIVDCHLARNAALGREQGEASGCPLNVKGATAKVRAVEGSLVVDVTATDAGAALEITKRARALAPAPSPPLSSQPALWQ
jgi:hypothetical protein